MCLGLKVLATFSILVLIVAISEVNTNLVEAYFTQKLAPRPQLEFRKLLAKDLINNKYLEDEQNKLKSGEVNDKPPYTIILYFHFHHQENLKAAKLSKLQANIIHRLHALGGTDK